MQVGSILSLNSVCKSFGIPGTANYRAVLSDLSMEVARGSSLAIKGPSGSGKTTLLNLIAALDRADSGTILFNGMDIARLSDRETDLYRNRSVGMVFQLHHLLPQCTLLENVLVPTLARLDKAKRSWYRERAEKLIRRMGIWEVRNQYPSQLSGGECQRTAVARALINDPDLLLADEPTGALDEAHALDLIKLLLEINQADGKTILLVTHSDELAKMTGSVLEMKDGKIR